MPAITRIYVVGAMSAQEAVWRKFVNVLALNIYKVDLAIVLDDISDPAWLLLADERLANGHVVLNLVAAAGVVRLADGRCVPTAPGAITLPARALRDHRGRPGALWRLAGHHRAQVLGRRHAVPGPRVRRGPGGLAGYVADLGPTGVMVARHGRT